MPIASKDWSADQQSTSIVPIYVGDFAAYMLGADLFYMPRGRLRPSPRNVRMSLAWLLSEEVAAWCPFVTAGII